MKPQVFSKQMHTGVSTLHLYKEKLNYIYLFPELRLPARGDIETSRTTLQESQAVLHHNSISQAYHPFLVTINMVLFLLNYYLGN